MGPHQPLGFFINNDKLKYISGPLITKAFRIAATTVEGITDPELLSRFSPHSIRVTTANLLHGVGKTPLYIQLRCRWKSQAFMMYLRNTLSLAKQHVHALSTLHLHENNIPADTADLKLDHLQLP